MTNATGRNSMPKIYPGRAHALKARGYTIQLGSAPGLSIHIAPEELGLVDLRLLLGEFRFDSFSDISSLTSVAQELADSGPSRLTVITRKFIHIHPDEFAG